MAKLIHSARTQLGSLSAFSRYLLALLGLLLLINITAAYVLHQKLVTERDQQALIQASRTSVQQMAADMRKRLQQLSESMAEIADSDAVQSALTAGGDAELARLAEELRGDREGLQSFHIIAADGARQPEPLSFAERDMIRRAARGEEVLPEASRVDNEWRVSLLHAITAGTDKDEATLPTGYLLLSVGLDHVLPISLDGSTELLQLLPNQQLQLVLKRGIGVDSMQPVEARSPNSAFTLRFTPSELMAASTTVSRLPFAASLALSGLLSISLALVGAAMLARKSAQRQSQYQAEAEDEVLDHLLKLEKQRRSGTSPAQAPIQDEDPVTGQNAPAPAFPHHIFRAYDIRGLAHSELTAELVTQIGKAIGSEALDGGHRSLAVARDGRLHSADINELLIAGILSTGCNVTDIGLVPTPLLYFACHELAGIGGGVMITASHNPSAYNGFKIVLGKETLRDEGIDKLRQRVLAKDFRKGKGTQDALSLEDRYIERVFSDLFLSGEPKVVIDAGNGATGQLAPRLFAELGCQVVPLFCEIDGNFPNHDPDPSVASNLNALVAAVKENRADLGLAFDGDGDRVVLVSASGRIVPSDQLLMMLAKDIVSRNPGADVVFDVKCSRAVGSVISAYGGRPLMWKSGHSHMKAKMQETGALLGGEFSGHIFIQERWYGFDDGLYAAARVLEIMSLREQDLDSILESFPVPPSTPEIKLPVAEADKFNLVEALVSKGDFGPGRATTIDGLRVDFAKGWGLVRASNTSPALTLRFEAESHDDLAKITALFKRELKKIHPALSLDF